MRIVHHGEKTFFELLLIEVGDFYDLIDGREVAAHAEDAVEDDRRPLHALRDLREASAQVVHVVVPVDGLVGGGHAGDAHGADDAVVVELVADPAGLGGGQGQRQPAVGRVGRVEDLRSGLADKGGDPRFERRMVGERPVDEAHGAGADAERMGGFVRGPDQLRVVGKGQIAVGVHADELLLGALQPVARPLFSLRREVGHDHPLRRLGPPLGL